MKKVIILLLCVFPVFCDYVTLNTGEQYIGEIICEDENILVIETIDEQVTISKELIGKVVEAPSIVGIYKKEMENARTAEDHFNLSKWCYENEHIIAGDTELAKALKIDPNIEKKVLKKVFKIEKQKKKEQEETQEETEKMKIKRRLSMRRYLSRLRGALGTERVEECKEKLRSFPDDDKAFLFVPQLRYSGLKYTEYRNFIIDELKNIPSVDHKVYIRHILKEPDRALREKTFNIIAGMGPEKTRILEDVMIKAVGSESTRFASRLIAEEMLGTMRSSRGVGVLVRRIRMTWGGGPRAHMMVVVQHAYIRDVTPVVAERSSSFDPEIDTYTTGVILDVKIRRVEREAIVKSLQTITNTYLPSLRDWVSWYNTKGKDIYK